MARSSNAASFDESFSAVRVYVPDFELSDLDTLRVSVFPSEESLSQETRTATINEHIVGIAIQKRVDPTTNSEVDAIAGLAEDIASHFRQRTLSGVDARWVSAEIDPLVDAQLLKTHRTATSVVSLTYRVLTT